MQLKLSKMAMIKTLYGVLILLEYKDLTGFCKKEESLLMLMIIWVLEQLIQNILCIMWNQSAGHLPNY
jgi:hypothetical protein